MNDDKKIILHSVTNEEQNSFVGLRIRNGEIHFHYPESYQLAQKEDKKAFRHDVVNIIRTISLAKSKSTININNDNGIAHNDQFAIMSYLWIIRYVNNRKHLHLQRILNLFVQQFHQ